MIVAIDLETTGVDYKKDKIIEVALVKFDENTFEIIEEFSTLIYPEVPIPELISNITNIFDEDVFASPTIEEMSFKIREFIGNFPILGHNVNFDKNFLIQNGINIENNFIIDTFFLANFLSYREKSLNLEFICSVYGYTFTGAHRALNDVKATIFLYEKLLLEFSKLSELSKNLLYFIFSKSRDLNIDYLKSVLFKGFKSLDMSFELFESSLLEMIGKYKIDENIKSEEHKNERKKQVKNDNFEKIYKSLGNIEKRENQLKMTNLVYETLNKSKKSVIEAPTGIGKSFAYLIPSILFSVKNSEKVFVTTKTKALQDQLYYKDLEFLSDKLGFSFSYTKIKGKSNYFCVKGYFDELNEYDIDYDKIGFLSKMTLWLLEDHYGELDDLNYYGKEYSYLRHINSDNMFVLNEKNPYKQYEFLYKARQKLSISDIIIINHSILFSDVALENSNLGTIKNLVIDEAHNIEDSVTESLRKKFSKNSLEEIFITIEKILTSKKIKKIDFLNKKDSIIDKIGLLLDYCLVYINKKNQNNNFNSGILVREDFFNELDLKDLITKLNVDIIDIVDMLVTLSTIHEIDLSREIGGIQNISSIVNIVFNKESIKNYICIASYYENSGVSVEYTLLNPGAYLEENIWSKLDSLVMTSATLKIGDNFNYLKNILSLKDENFNFFTYSQEFDYKKQATLIIPNDLGSIKNNSKIVVEFLKGFYEAVRGKTLTLFTSFYSIREVYTTLNFHLKKLGINLYPQGIGGGKSKLINFYLESPDNSILLGTDSFWEGIDIPGDNLKYLVIHKIPFMVPNDPIFLARSSLFKNPFTDYSIPKSIIKLKQGFGRLIRSKKDTGLVILLDDRIYSTDWGNMFYDAFPSEINIKKCSSKIFLDLLNKDKN